MLVAFDSLYVCGAGSQGVGLYPLRDTDGDDRYDQVTHLKQIRGSGEHGPHGLRLTPDGTSIVLVAGNHTQTQVPGKSIEAVKPSAVSLMPEKLLAPLNENEVLDLLAYLLSRGDASDPMFR